MADYVEPAGGVRTWYDEHGAGPTLVLLHGALIDARSFEANIGPLAERFTVLTPERRGHGHTPDVVGPITYDLMTQDMIAFLEAVVDGPADLVGHSDGANIAMLIAMRRPELVRRLVLVSGNFHRDGLVPGTEEFDLDQAVALLGPAYGEVSPDGEQHFPIVARKLQQLQLTEPALLQSELTRVRSRTLVMFGDDDLVTGEHINAMYAGIPDSELAVVPGTSHLLLQEKPELCNAILLDFLTKEPVPTVFPVRRAPASRVSAA